MTLLWVTRAALADLGFEAHSSKDAYGIRNRHPILQAFFDKRERMPTGTEQLKGVPREREIWNLHAENPHRGVTWWDTEEDVVFLLAHSTHDYKEFVSRFYDDRLLPTDADYADLRAHQRRLSRLDDDFVEVVAAEAPDLVARALLTPGVVVDQLLGGELHSVALLEAIALADDVVTGDVYVVLRFSDRQRNRTIPGNVIADLAPILFPDAELSDLDWAPSSVPSLLSRRPEDPVMRWIQR